MGRDLKNEGERKKKIKRKEMGLQRARKLKIVKGM